MRSVIEKFLDDKKIDDITCIDIKGRSPFMDYIVIGTGTSRRHISSVANALKSEMKSHGVKNILLDASSESDWAAVMCEGVLVNLFNGAEQRQFYDIENVWREK